MKEFSVIFCKILKKCNFAALFILEKVNSAMLDKS